MPAKVVVLGGGVGGTLVANLLHKELGRDASVTVVDPTGMHVYQPGFLYVALGQANGRWLTRDERTLLRRGVELVVERAVRIHPEAGTVQLERGGSLDYDYLVLSTGARLVPEQVPGLAEATHEFYSLEGAQRLREELSRFKGGRIHVGIAGIPYKCPPAPIEFMLHAGRVPAQARYPRSELDHAAFAAEPVRSRSSLPPSSSSRCWTSGESC